MDKKLIITVKLKDDYIKNDFIYKIKMIYLNDALNHYNTNLILENCVSTIQKEQRKNFVFNPIPKNFLNIIMNLVFSLKYKIIF